jgi:hypothetical protein
MPQPQSPWRRSGTSWRALIVFCLGAACASEAIAPEPPVDDDDEPSGPGAVPAPSPDKGAPPKVPTPPRGETSVDAASPEAPPAADAAVQAQDAEAPAGDPVDGATPSDASGGMDAAPAAPPPSPGARPSRGCATRARPMTGLRTVTINGTRRQFVLRVPEGYDGSRPQPVLFFLHGCSATGPSAETTHARGFRTALGPHAILLYPSSDGNCWLRNPAADHAFFDEMMRILREETCMDENRVFLTGISSGGYLTNSLACARGDRIRGIIPVASGPVDWRGCKGPVDTMVVHSPRDSVVPYSRGLQVRDYWRRTNGCSERTGRGIDAICEEHEGCMPGKGLSLCKHMDAFYQNTFHGWPTIANRLILTFIQARR